MHGIWNSLEGKRIGWYHMPVMAVRIKYDIKSSFIIICSSAFHTLVSWILKF